MDFPIFQSINLILLAIVLIFLTFHLWDTFFGSYHAPESYKQAKREGKLTKSLLKLERSASDKIRFYNFWLQIERLKHDRVVGDFAELGVYKGNSAKMLQEMDPERMIHLFDTFTGFPSTDLEGESGDAAAYTSSNFADTDAKSVMDRFKYPGNIKLHPGYFPQTATGLEMNIFSLVNIDVDLYKPTKSGLDFFYPKLAPGGVILVHDHNHRWDGVMRAIAEFRLSSGATICPVPDKDNTIIIFSDKKNEKTFVD